MRIHTLRDIVIISDVSFLEQFVNKKLFSPGAESQNKERGKMGRGIREEGRLRSHCPHRPPRVETLRRHGNY